MGRAVGRFRPRNSDRQPELSRTDTSGSEKAPKDGVKISSWHSTPVRHTAADEITAQLGPAAAQARLGHAHLETTDIDRSRQVAEVVRIASVPNAQPQRSTTA
jgi:hypothetical protein